MSKPTCSVGGCDEVVRCRALCAVHYHRQIRTGSTQLQPRPSAEERFWAKVDKRGPGECWPWTGARTGRGGYGNFWFEERYQHASAAAYKLVKGPVPTGMLVRHTCDNPPCVNPAHLLIGTDQDNKRDAIERGRFRGGWVPGEANGNARLTGEQVKEIRARYQRGGISWRQLAAEYGVTKSAIAHVLRGRSWAHLLAANGSP